MEDAYRRLKARYDLFLKGYGGDPLTLKMDAERLLSEAKAKSNCNLAMELKEILLDLAFLVDEMKCNCPMSGKCRC